MKILSVTAQKPDSTGSGVYLTELVKEFHKSGIEQQILCGVTRGDIVEFPEGIAVHKVYYKSEELPYPVLGMSDEMPYESTRYCDMTEEMTEEFRLAFGEKVRSVVHKFDPDVILCHHMYYLAALIRELFPEKKMAVLSHGSDLRQIQKNPWQRDYIVKQMCKMDFLLALHEKQKEEICRIFHCDKQHVIVVGTGYNRDLFRILPELQKDSDVTRLIFAGKISEKKGIMSLIRALDRIPHVKEDYQLALAGGAGNEREYKEICFLAKESACEVEFLGKLPQTELVQELNRSDVFVLPSFFEGLPLVLMEAMACGLNVVCTELPGIREWLDANVPNHGVILVKPPKMEDTDEPVKEELPEFELRLAEAIQIATAQPKPEMEAVMRNSWKALCERLLQYLS